MVVEAYINRRLRCNLITRSLANRLALDIVDIAVVCGSYNGNMIRKDGLTTLPWDGVSLECYVCDDLPRPLVFGRQFIDNHMLSGQAMTQRQPGQHGDRT